MNTLNSLKGTGRTTRMLKEAQKLSSEGRAVYIVAATPAHAQQLQNQLDNAGRPNHGIKCETDYDLGFNWERLSVRGAHPNAVFLIDHGAIESHFGALLHELHRFDQPSN